jgi:hypothetical protein
MSVRCIAPIDEKQLTDHDLVGAIKNHGDPFIRVGIEKKCREGHQGHKHEENDVDPK